MCAPIRGHSAYEEPTLKADPAAQLKLLDIAGLDGRLGRLRHQLRSLPEHQKLADLQARRTEVDNLSRDARILVDDLTRDQKKSDQDVDQVRKRRERDRSRMDQGLITNPKDLERMTHELVSLERRINDLEDVELEIMARLEDAQRDHDRFVEEVAQLDAEIADTVASRDEQSASVQADLAAADADRQAAADGVPAELLTIYERVREKQGSGAALLRARRCEGCQLSLDSSAMAAIVKASADEVVRCEECTRILVRTDESGL